MKRIILFLITMLTMNLAAFSNTPADTNKTDNTGKKTGFWKEKIASFDFYGNYVNDKKEGLWIAYYGNGIIGTIEEYKNGRKNGYSILLDKTGFYYQKDYYVNDTLNGLSVSYYSGSKLKSE